MPSITSANTYWTHAPSPDAAFRPSSRCKRGSRRHRTYSERQELIDQGDIDARDLSPAPIIMPSHFTAIASNPAALAVFMACAQ